jgi:hypothetical protein
MQPDYKYQESKRGRTEKIPRQPLREPKKLGEQSLVLWERMRWCAGQTAQPSTSTDSEEGGEPVSGSSHLLHATNAKTPQPDKPADAQENLNHWTTRNHQHAPIGRPWLRGNDDTGPVEVRRQSGSPCRQVMPAFVNK